MPVPDYETLMLPVLRTLAAGAQNVSQCLPALKEMFQITDEEAAELTPSGKSTLLSDRAHWARTYMAKAGLLTSPKKNFHIVTPLGLKLLASKPAKIDNDLLDQNPEFLAWRTKVLPSPQVPNPPSPLPKTIAPSAPALTPEDSIKAAYEMLLGVLRDELLVRLREMTPTRFERLILKLLSAMRYGDGDLSRTEMTKTTGDGGIDGIIREDALGLDRIYIQAKRYGQGNNVGSPAIQQFAGSLVANGAGKGVFVTTSEFTKDAIATAAAIKHHRIVLIDGQEFARLMIHYGVGIRAQETFTIFSINENVFSDD